MKSVIEKRKIIPLLVFVLFGLLNIFNLSSGIALYMQGESATFSLDKDDPLGYGVIIPGPNMYTTVSIDGSNQGEFVIMDWDGGNPLKETINIPGNNLNMVYPLYFEDYYMNSVTDNDYIDPWIVKWLNISAFEAENESLLPYTLNSVFNYYIMAEESELTVPLNQSFPMQIDLLISHTGPKILKFDWVIDNPNNNPLNSYNLISPSGKSMDLVPNPIAAQNIFSNTVFSYIPFVAHETGTYRLLLEASYPSNPAFLKLDFLDFSLNNLNLDELTYGGDGDEFPSYQDYFDDEWDAEWFRIEGSEGEKYTLDIGYDYIMSTPLINIYYPGEHVYLGDFNVGAGTFDIYFPRTGYAYISFIDGSNVGTYKTSLYLKKIPEVEHNIGGNITTVKVSRDQRKAINFKILNDSFVRFNYTQVGRGNAQLSSMGINNGIIFEDAKNVEGYEIFTPIQTKSVYGMDFFYYYLPNGTYQAILKNEFVDYDGVLQISSKIVTWENSPIPINSLTYPEINPTQFSTLKFEPDGYNSSLKEGIGIGINITEPGQYRLNITMNLSDYMEVIPPLSDPSAVVFYNFSSDEYTDYTLNATTQFQSFPVFTDIGDSLYIAFTSKFQEMYFNFSQLGNNDNNQDLFPYVWHDNAWFLIDILNDNTEEFEVNGSWINDISDPDYINWEKGNDDIELPNINENDFYWLQINCEDDYDGDGGGPPETIPFIDLIQLNFSRISLEGEMNFALVRESGYKYSDYWELTAPTDISLIYYQKIENLTFSDEQWLFGASSDPFILGLEEGYYKLLIIPEGWSYEGPIEIQFGIENYWDYGVERTFTITDEPLAYPWQIGNLVNVSDPILYNYSTYPYDFTVAFNDTIVSWDDYTGDYEGYIVLNCFGAAYSWTQLVVEASNITDYNLYLMQELPWIDGNGPNMEIVTIDTSIGANNTIEFGVIRDNFTLLFEYNGSGNENIVFNIGLRQYNTTALYSNEITASYTLPSNGGGEGLIITVAIIIPSLVVGTVIVVYVLRRKHRVLTKTP